MIQLRFRFLVLLGVVAAAAGPVYSQQQASQSSSASSASASAPPATQGPIIHTPTPVVSEDTLKRAKAVGLHPEVRKGVTVYCWEDADLGTHFPSKKCVDENRLDEMIQKLEIQRQQKLQGH